MENVYDLGGKAGFGKIPYVDDDREYKERWEFVLMSITRLGYAKKLFRADALRYAIERIPAEAYLADPYYSRMLTGATQLSIEAGHVKPEDLARHAPDHVTFPSILAPEPGHSGGGFATADRFEVGQRVTVRTEFPRGHVRVPGYVKGKSGTLIRKGHRLPFPGQAGHREEADLERTWLVQFDRSDLWPETADRGSLTVDLWDSYLEPADAPAD